MSGGTPVLAIIITTFITGHCSVEICLIIIIVQVSIQGSLQLPVFPVYSCMSLLSESFLSCNLTCVGVKYLSHC